MFLFWAQQKHSSFWETSLDISTAGPNPENSQLLWTLTLYHIPICGLQGKIYILISKHLHWRMLLNTPKHRVSSPERRGERTHSFNCSERMHSDLGTIYAENSMILASSPLPGPLLRTWRALSALGCLQRASWNQEQSKSQDPLCGCSECSERKQTLTLKRT